MKSVFVYKLTRRQSESLYKCKFIHLKIRMYLLALFYMNMQRHYYHLIMKNKITTILSNSRPLHIGYIKNSLFFSLLS